MMMWYNDVRKQKINHSNNVDDLVELLNTLKSWDVSINLQIFEGLVAWRWININGSTNFF
jgi:hypothetical protein